VFGAEAEVSLLLNFRSQQILLYSTVTLYCILYCKVLYRYSTVCYSTVIVHCTVLTVLYSYQ
jgi:hypothetical protein